MRIGLNLLQTRPEVGGIWNYALRLTSALGKYDNINQYVAFVTQKHPFPLPDTPNFQVVPVNVSTSNLARITYENSLLHHMTRVHRLDILHWFGNTQSLRSSIPDVVSVHDLMLFETGCFTPIKRLYLKTMMRHTVKRSAWLLPVSHTTANNLRRFLNADPRRMTVLPAIVDEKFQPAPADKIAAFRHHHHLPDPFWLYVGHFYSHKNHIRLLHAYHALKSRGFGPWPLVFRGDDHGEWKAIRRTIERLGLQKDVFRLPRLDEETMPVLFSAASGLVFPSLYEGGGIPVLEAMACGCPVIASDISAVREFGGDDVARFNPLDIASIAACIQAFQERCPAPSQNRRPLQNRFEAHHPQHIAIQTMNVYLSISNRYHAARRS